VLRKLANKISKSSILLIQINPPCCNRPNYPYWVNNSKLCLLKTVQSILFATDLHARKRKVLTLLELMIKTNSFCTGYQPEEGRDAR
jgi:hypothetical protein